MKLSDTKPKLACFVIMALFPFIITCYNFQADLVLLKMGLYWPNFSLVLLIHLFLYAGVCCNLTSSLLPREKNAAHFFVIMTGNNAVLNFF